MDESIISNETNQSEKELINELDVMNSYINGIDNHLKYKEMILKTVGVSFKVCLNLNLFLFLTLVLFLNFEMIQINCELASISKFSRWNDSK